MLKNVVHHKNLLRLNDLTASVLAVAGLSFLGAGVYKRHANMRDNIDLDFSDKGHWGSLVSVSSIVIAIGVLLVVACVLGVVVPRKTHGIARHALKILLFCLLLGLLVWTVFIAATALALVTGRSPAGLREFVHDSWNVTVGRSAAKACKVQFDFRCVGFADDECRGCAVTTRDGCTPAQARACPRCATMFECPACPDFASLRGVTAGCYGAVLAGLRRWLTPCGVIAAVISAFIFLDMLLLLDM